MSDLLAAVERLSRDKERLRAALDGVLHSIALDVPRVYPDLKSWAEANKDAGGARLRGEARAVLAAYDALTATQEPLGAVLQNAEHMKK